jgi:glutamyl-tRNA synthetase
MTSPIRGRFAPTPSGELHLGGARTALLAWLQVRQTGGAWVLRIEDLDQSRAVPGAEARIVEDLRWLGFDWDEGPDTGGPFAPYRQSERTALFDEVVERLLREERAFLCYCSRAEVARVSQAPHNALDEGPRYPGTCRTLTRAQKSERSRHRPASVRLRVDEGTVEFVDGLHGHQSEDVAKQVGDFVLRRADGTSAYQLAVVVDDIQMQISDVLRGDDLLSSTARQLLLYRALGSPAPRFTHVPLLLGPDGSRLSKRHGSISVRELGARLSTPRIIGLLGETLGLCDRGAERRPRDLLSHFSLTQLPTLPTHLDPTLF